MLIEYRFRLRDAADTTDVVSFTSVRGDAAPYIADPPKGDGASFDPTTGQSIISSYTVTIVDCPTTAMQRALTSQLEDASFRQQLGYRKAFVEYRQNGGVWKVLICGVLSLLRLTDAITYEATVMDYTRAQHGAQAFGAASDTTSLASLVDTYSTGSFSRGAIFGGPLFGAAAFTTTIKDLGGWAMKVSSLGISPAIRYKLVATQTVYGPPNFTPGLMRSKAGIPQWLSDLRTYAGAINDVAAKLKQSTSATMTGGATFSTLADAQLSLWSGLVFLINDGTHGWVPFRPVPANIYSNADYHNAPDDQSLLLNMSHLPGAVFCVQDDQPFTLTAGATVRVRCITILPSEDSPTYFDGNPIDLMTGLWAAAGIPYDATTAATVRGALGDGERLICRITATQDLDQFLQSAVQQPYGVGVRGNDAGQLVPFLTRVMPNTLPAVTIDKTAVADGSTSLPFELDTAAGLHSIKVTQKVLQPSPSSGSESMVLDGVIESETTFTLMNGDTTALQFGTIELNVPGMMTISGANDGALPVVAEKFKPMAQDWFDRAGHGGIALETTLLAGVQVGTDPDTDAPIYTEDLHLGDEVLVQLSELPNHNYRLADNAEIPARGARVVRGATDFS